MPITLIQDIGTKEMAEAYAEVLEGLMGEDSQPKKDFVFSRINFEDIEV